MFQAEINKENQMQELAMRILDAIGMAIGLVAIVILFGGWAVILRILF